MDSYILNTNNILPINLPVISKPKFLMCWNVVNFFGELITSEEGCIMTSMKSDKTGFYYSQWKRFYNYINTYDITMIGTKFQCNYLRDLVKSYKMLMDHVSDCITYIEVKDKNDAEKELDKLVNKNSKFDICLMNPPYGSTGGDDIHYKFTENCLGICDEVICIMPYALVDKSTKPNPAWRKKLSPNIVEIVRINSNIFAGTDQTDVGIYTFIGNNILNCKDDSYLQTEHIKLVDSNGNIRYCSELTITPFNTYELLFVNLLKNNNKNVINFGYLSHENTYVNNYVKKNNIVLNTSNEKTIKDIVRQERIRKEAEKLPNGKVAIICNFYEGSNKTGFHAKFIGDITGRIVTKPSDIQNFLKETKTTSGYNLICCDDILSAENCKIAIQNPLLRFCLSKIQVDRCMQPSVCYQYIPDIDWSDPRVVTDEGLLEVCGCPKDKCNEYAEYCRKYMEEFDKQHQLKKKKVK